MSKEMPEVLVETMMELLSSHRHLAELLEETIRRQDDLIYELRAAADKNRPGLPSERSQPSQQQSDLMDTGSRPTSSHRMPEHCQICRHSTLHHDAITAYENEMALPGYMEAEWSGYPLWDGYGSNGVRPMYRRTV
jgi:hypothetical protein